MNIYCFISIVFIVPFHISALFAGRFDLFNFGVDKCYIGIMKNTTKVNILLSF